MTDQQTFEQKIKAIGILRWAVPLSSLIAVVLCYFVLEDELKRIVPMALLGLAVVEFFAFTAIANKMERKAQRDRG